MKSKLIILSLSLFLTTSTAIKCYSCLQIVSKSETIDPGSCAGGNFDSKALNKEISIEDCRNSTFCYKVTETLPRGNSTYLRSCPFMNDVVELEEKCVEGETLVGGNYKACACKTDLCNGATDLYAGHAVIGLVTSIVATMFATQY